MKICSKCRVEKDESEFSKSKDTKDSLRHDCKKCNKEYYNNNKEKIEKKQKKYRKDNKEKLAEWQKLYATENKEKIKKRKKQYAIDNKEEISKYKKQYAIDNKESIDIYQKQYNKQYRNTFNGWFINNWGHINSRTVNGRYPNYKSKQAMSYIKKGIEVRVSKQELYDWCYSQILKINIMLKQGKIVKGLMPSLDRIDSKGHYELSNLQIITVTENKKKH